MGAKGAALMLPFANTAAMQMHLDEISRNVAAKAHGVVLMDRAGWHSTDQLKVPKLTIILLPSRSPDLTNPAAIALARSEPGREHLAIPPPELAL